MVVENMGKVNVSPCKCQPQLDLINKFHHLDLHHAFLKKYPTEEIHHCGSLSRFDMQYMVKHCSCNYKSDCHNCSRNGLCPARVVHAINLPQVKIYIHLSFMNLPSEMCGPIIITLSEPCPENDGYYHIDADKCEIKWGGLDDMLRWKSELMRLGPLARWAIKIREVKKKEAGAFNRYWGLGN